jgi:hypothetical protein
MVTSSIKNDMLLEGIVIILVTSFGSPDWLEQIMPDTLVYAISTKQLGYEDNNLITEHPSLDILDEYYTGPAIDLLKLGVPRTEKPAPAPVPVESDAVGEAQPPGDSASTTEPADNKPKRGRKKTKFKIKPDVGEPKTAPSYEKALEMAKKLESEGRKVEVYPPDSEEASYISGLGELDK